MCRGVSKGKARFLLTLFASVLLSACLKYIKEMFMSFLCSSRNWNTEKHMTIDCPEWTYCENNSWDECETVFTITITIWCPLVKMFSLTLLLQSESHWLDQKSLDISSCCILSLLWSVPLDNWAHSSGSHTWIYITPFVAFYSLKICVL